MNASATSADRAMRATEMAQAIRGGRVTSEQLVRDALDRAVANEPLLAAWAHLDRPGALAQAQALDQSNIVGPLHGIPVAIKDITDTAHLPAAYGSPIYAGNIPAVDAPPVALIRAAGAVILGKTATVEFAASSPARTRNPRNPAHTPGGSSSGSAAAVSDLQVPLATGTQTGGSIIRPAAYCGVVGFKPSFGRLAMSGTKCSSWSLDTFGLFAGTVADATLFYSVLAGESGVPRSAASAIAPRIGLFQAQSRDADAVSVTNLERAVSVSAKAGARVHEIELPFNIQEAVRAQQTICRYEMVRSLASERLNHPRQLSASLTQDLVEGEAISLDEYDAAQSFAAGARASMSAVFSQVDVVISYAASGEAPHGLESTGSSLFCSAWTLLHAPALCLPYGHGPQSLPLGVQVTGAAGSDASLLHFSAWLERALIS